MNVLNTSQKILEMTRMINLAVNQDKYNEANEYLKNRFVLLKNLVNSSLEEKQLNFTLEIKKIFEEIYKLDSENRIQLNDKKDEVASVLVSLYNSKELKKYLR
jgi:hypothetical protein